MARRKPKPRYRPWPLEAQEPYQKITELLGLLYEDIEKSINRGTRIIPRNKFVIEALIDFIVEGCQELDQACQKIIDLFEEERVGRPPKWLTLTEEVQERVIEILELARKVKPALKVNKLPYLVDVYDEMKLEAGEIKDLLETYPYRTKAVALEQAAEIVNREFQQ